MSRGWVCLGGYVQGMDVSIQSVLGTHPWIWDLSGGGYVQRCGYASPTPRPGIQWDTVSKQVVHILLECFLVC